MEFLILVAAGTAALLVIISLLVKRIVPEVHNKISIISFTGFLLISIGIIVYSYIAGGWKGMGYGLLGLAILSGTIIGGIIQYMLSVRSRIR